MRRDNENHPDHDTEATGQTGCLPVSYNQERRNRYVTLNRHCRFIKRSGSAGNGYLRANKQHILPQNACFVRKVHLKDRFFRSGFRSRKPSTSHLPDPGKSSKSYFLYNRPGLSNKRFRLWFATLSQSNLIRYKMKSLIVIDSKCFTITKIGVCYIIIFFFCILGRHTCFHQKKCIRQPK